MDLTALTLFGRARFKVLACFFAGKQRESIYLRELARRIGLSPTASQYELRLLLRTGLIVQEGTDKRPTYRCNRNHPIAAELQQMIQKMDASKQAQTIEDDSFWSRKRAGQKSDYASRSLKRKSSFLANQKLASSLSANLRKDVSYEY